MAMTAYNTLTRARVVVGPRRSCVGACNVPHPQSHLRTYLLLSYVLLYHQGAGAHAHIAAGM